MTRKTYQASPATLPRHAEALLEQGHRLALVAAHHDEPGIRVVYLFVAGPPDTRVELHVRLDPDRPTVPSLAHLSFPAGRFEREMRDLFGIVPLDHPLPRRLVRHFHWPRGWYPMRPDAGPPPDFGEPEGPYPFLEVEGDGVYEIPVGPVHAGLIEPGHFRFSVEEATGTQVPEQAQHARAMLLELERIHNHIADLGMLCNDVGHSVLNAHAQRVREQLLRLNKEITGHRLLRGGVMPGGAALRDLPDPARLKAIGADIREITDLALGHSTVRDRFTGTAILHTAAAREIGCLGYVARASGIAADARIAHPFTPYDGTGLTVPVHDTGDVLARFLIRVEEIDISLALIEHVAVGLPTPSALLAPPPAPGSGPGTGVGLVEGWRGTIATRVELTPDGTLTRVKPVDPSFFNWPALPVALADTIVPDFPLTNKSFNLSYAGNDL